MGKGKEKKKEKKHEIPKHMEMKEKIESAMKGKKK
jgi:hypothetical protein